MGTSTHSTKTQKSPCAPDERMTLSLLLDHSSFKFKASQESLHFGVREEGLPRVLRGGMGSVVAVWVSAVPIRSGGDVELGCWRMLGIWGGDPDRTGPQPPPKGPNGGLGNRSSHPTAAM